MQEKIKQETLEYGLLQHIKMCIECNNESQAIRLIEKYGFEQQEIMYSELIDLLERITPIYKEDSDLYQKYEKQRLDIIEQFKKK